MLLNDYARAKIMHDTPFPFQSSCKKVSELGKRVTKHDSKSCMSGGGSGGMVGINGQKITCYPPCLRWAVR